MLKYQLCQLDLDICCDFKGPLLIRDGRYKKDGNAPEIPHSIFISRDSDEQVKNVARDAQKILNPEALQYYVPASSIRGWLRSHAERIMRTRSTDDKPLCCNPFDNDPNKENATGCTKRLQNLPEEKGPAYKCACVICKIFGCGGLAARISFSDGTLANFKVRLVDGIGIDRFTGGVASTKSGEDTKGVNFKNHALEGGHFTFRLTLRNFEIWQLGLLAFVLRDLEQGALKIGFGKTKGFGKIKGSITNGVFTYARALTENKLAGFPDLMPSLQEKYDAIPFIIASGLEGQSLSSPVLTRGAADAWQLTHRYNVPLPERGKTLIDSEFWTACAQQWLLALPQFKSIPELNSMCATPQEQE